MKHSIGLQALLMVAALGGIGAQGCVSKPTMHLNHAEIHGIQLLAIPPNVQMVVVVDVRNPNGFDVAVRAMRGTITMAGKYPVAINFVAPGDGLWLAADASTAIRIPIALPVDVALKVSMEAVQTPNIAYRFAGKADVSASRTFKVEEDDYAIDEPGEITRAQLLAILPNSLLAPR
jgi:LEA14-like dessication related protein